jgi:hypothetical protein
MLIIKCLYSALVMMSHEKNRHLCGGWGSSDSLYPRWYTPKPSVGIIAHGVGVISVHSAGASSGHRQMYEPKLLTTMVSRPRKILLQQR